MITEDQPTPNENPIPGAPLTESEKVAQANFMRASSSLGQIMVEMIQRSGGQVNFTELMLLTQSLLINFDAIAQVVFENVPGGREKFWTLATELYDRNTSQRRQSLILSNGPKLVTPK